MEGPTEKLPPRGSREPWEQTGSGPREDTRFRKDMVSEKKLPLRSQWSQ